LIQSKSAWSYTKRMNSAVEYVQNAEESRRIDRLVDDFTRAYLASVTKAGALAFDVLGGGTNKRGGPRVGPFPT
jgi:hypothetical protein